MTTGIAGISVNIEGRMVDIAELIAVVTGMAVAIAMRAVMAGTVTVMAGTVGATAVAADLRLQPQIFLLLTLRRKPFITLSVKVPKG
jgi:hypothetical protein